MAVTKTAIGKQQPGKRNTRRPKTSADLVNEQALLLLRECAEAKTIDQALEIITNKACVLVGGKGGSVWLRSSTDPSKIVLRRTYRPDGPNVEGRSYYTNLQDENGFYDGLTGYVFATGRPLCLSDITDPAQLRQPGLRWSDKYGGYAQAADKEKQRHFMAVPIFSCRAKREVIGVLRIAASKKARGFSHAQLELLQTYSGYISGLLTNYLKREEEKTLIENLFTAVAGQLDLDLLLNETAQTIPLVMDGSHCSIFLKDAEGSFCLEATSAPHLRRFTRKEAGELCLKYGPGESKTGQVAQTGRSVRVNGNIAGKPEHLCECGTKSSAFLCVAIHEMEQSEPVGVLRVVRDLEIGEMFDDEDESFLEGFGHKLYGCLRLYGYFLKGTCFVILPFEEEFEAIYETIIKPTVEKFSFKCLKEDEFPAIGSLTSGIISHIANASFIVADITGRNPNVFYELGIAHTMEKFVVLLTQEENQPADVRHWKYIKYSNKAGQARAIEEELHSAIRGAIASGRISDKQART